MKFSVVVCSLLAASASAFAPASSQVGSANLDEKE